MSRDLTIENEKDGYGSSYSVYEFSTYGSSSVLAGQTKKQYLDGYDTLEEARRDYPTAKVCGYRDAYNTFDHLPDGPDINW